MLHLIHDTFFYCCYFVFALVLVHRIVAPVRPCCPATDVIPTPEVEPEAPIIEEEPAPIAPEVPAAMPSIRRLKKLARGVVKNYGRLTQQQLFDALVLAGVAVT